MFFSKYIIWGCCYLSLLALPEILNAKRSITIGNEYIGSCENIVIDNVEQKCGNSVFHTLHTNGFEVLWLSLENPTEIITIISTHSENIYKQNGEVLIKPHIYFVGVTPFNTNGMCLVKNLGTQKMSFRCRLEDNSAGWLNIKFDSETKAPFE